MPGMSFADDRMTGGYGANQITPAHSIKSQRKIIRAEDQHYSAERSVFRSDI
jgi:hypothetical protein